MDQISVDNEVKLIDLAEYYRKKRLDFLQKNWFTWRSIPLRAFGATSERKRLLNLELSFQYEMRKDIRKMIKLNKSDHKHLKEYSHALKTISMKYSERNTDIIISFILIGLLLKLIELGSLYWGILFIFVLVLYERIIINITVSVYKELILLIDEYVDSSSE
jgi:hypothetical protein